MIDERLYRDNLDKRRGDSAKNDRSVSFLFASMNLPLNSKKAEVVPQNSLLCSWSIFCSIRCPHTS
jgi:hypothetical protein